jgi:glycosyltransferase involved in cell wall biosynthesis
MQSILALSFYAAYHPPRTGGELRLYYIYHFLSKYYDINLITFINPTLKNVVEIIEHNKNFKEFRVPRSRTSLYIQKFLIKLTNIKEWSAILVSLDSKFNKKFKELIDEKLNQSDIIIFISPFLFTFENKINNNINIYESYNLEYELMKSFLSQSLLGKLFLNYIFDIERSLCEKSDLIFAVSEGDRSMISELYNIDINKISLSPNGVNPKDYEFLKDSPRGINENPLILFIGSYHPPNFEAVQNLINLAGRVLDAQFLIAGGVSLYYITYFSDILELAGNNISMRFCQNRNKDVYLANGFYSVEEWCSIPTRWSKPAFNMGISDDIDSVELKLFSPQAQQLKVTSGEILLFFNLSKGWNVIQLLNKKQRRHLISFSCEKPISDPRGALGVAVQSIIYVKHNNKFDADLAAPIREIFTFKNAKNVFLLGQISDDEKKELYRIADISLNPMTSGSGTNIKMLDYMAAGLPVITTPIGARGLGLENYTHAIICDIIEFPAKIREILTDMALYSKLSCNGRKIVEKKYDWEKIADDMARTISETAIKTKSSKSIGHT